MGEPPDLPPIDVVSVTEISYAGASRLRIQVTISPEVFDAMPKVVLAVVDGHAGVAEIVWISFFYTAEATMAASRPEGRACFVRNDIDPVHRPQLPQRPHCSLEIETARGRLTVERPSHR